MTSSRTSSRKSAEGKATPAKTAEKKSTQKKSAQKKSASKGPSKQAGAGPSPQAPGKAKGAADQYTKPELREKIKNEVMAGTRGGAAGQWSARKAQLVAAEYEKQGGGYKHSRNETQEHLHEWTNEHWSTADGKAAKRAGGTARYLPEKAWDQLSAEEKRATNKKKLAGSKEGRQHVPNTTTAKKARKQAQEQPE